MFWNNIGEPSMKPEIIDTINRIGLLRTFERGDSIYNQGDIPQGVYFLRSGLVGLVSASSAGNEHLLRLFRSNEFFGHRSYLADEMYHATSKCLEKTAVVFLAKEDFRRCIAEHPEILWHITRKMAKELRLAEESRVTITDHDVLTRTAEALVYLKEIHPEHNWTRQEIAEFCDSTAPTIVRTLGKLEERNLIETSGRSIEIRDRDGLLSLSE